MESVLPLLFPCHLSIAELVSFALTSKAMYGVVFSTENNPLSSVLSHVTECGTQFNMQRFQRKMRRRWICGLCQSVTRNTKCSYRGGRRRRLCHSCVQEQLVDRKQVAAAWRSKKDVCHFGVRMCQVPILLQGMQVARLGAGQGHRHLYWKVDIEDAMCEFAATRYQKKCKHGTRAQWHVKNVDRPTP